MTNPPKEKDTPKEAANELEEKLLRMLRGRIEPTYRIDTLVADIIAEHRRLVGRAIEVTLKELESIDYPPSGKEWHFYDGTWSNSINEAVRHIEDMTWARGYDMGEPIDDAIEAILKLEASNE